MKNADAQAFPVAGLSELPNGEFMLPGAGMTKLEFFALTLAAGRGMDTTHIDSHRTRAVWAVHEALALLAALEPKK